MRRGLTTLLLATLPLYAAAATSLQTVSSEQMVAAAREQLGACLGADKEAAEIAVIGKPEDVLVLPGRLTIHARQPDGRLPRARVGMPVDISVNGSVVRSATVWFSISVHHDVPSYAADAVMGTAAASLKFTPHDADVALLQGRIISGPQELDGMRLRHPVVAGSPVLREDFEHMPDVDRKQRIEVQASFGAVQMQTRGTSIGRGNVGEVVSVLVDGAETPVQARVTDKGVVQVVD
jgi:flagella basal body P-ring formation protein FlgA